jgi:hypothetical protein
LPGRLDVETGQFTYYGGKEKPGEPLNGRTNSSVCPVRVIWTV